MALFKTNQETYARLFKMLLKEPVTAHELAEESGIHLVTAQSLMRTLKKHKVVHVVGWIPDALDRDVTPIYKLGEGRDKPRRKLSHAERQRRHRARKEAKQQQLLLMGMLTNHAKTKQVQTEAHTSEPCGVCA